MRSILLLALCLCLGGCATSQHGHSIALPAEIARLDRVPVEHIVLCWLRHPRHPQAIRQLLNTSDQLRTIIPGIQRISAGTPLPSERPMVDSTFDVAIVMTFRNEAALRAYEKNPEHQKAVKEILQPLTRRVVVFDFHQLLQR